jgi:glycosyltransferase involved in cell wall biosynthesis
MFFSYVLFRILAFAIYAWRKSTGRWSFDLTQGSDSCVGFTDGAYVHFCHRVYVSRWLRAVDLLSPRGLTRAVSHFFQSALEGHFYRRAKFVVVVSKGLWRELAETHAIKSQELVLIPNPVDIERYTPDSKQRRQARLDLDFKGDRPVLVFVALGHFERKGLGPLIEALADPRLKEVRLLVVGGAANATRQYRTRAQQLGLERRVTFCGTHKDPRKFLWAADAFVLPSRYETFSLVTFEAAASGLPVITTHLNGVEEFAKTGETGFLIREHSTAAIADAIREFLELSPGQRVQLGENARAAVARYGIQEFVAAWESLYARLLGPDAA